MNFLESWIDPVRSWRLRPGAICLFLGILSSSNPGVRAGESAASWWEAETALDATGGIRLDAKSWWPRAQALKTGEHFRVRSGLPGGGEMLVRREHLTRANGQKAEAIVWVIDDDGDMRPADRDGDRDNDCSVVDYDGDGLADRLVDYIRGDGAARPDEMQIRYFLEGRLRRAWFFLDLDHDGKMWDLAGYEYSGNFFRSDPHGNNLIFLNEFDPERKAWVPNSECPFAFYDTAGDGLSGAVVRISAVPLEFDPVKEPDYANSIFWYTGPFTERMRHVGAVNVRYSLDLDGLRSADRPLHYDLGFNLVGRVPYDFPGMAQTNPKRRSPKTAICIPHADARRLAESYPAEQAGCSWREYWDDAIQLGAPPHAQESRRWEGVFWTWSRRIMHNTGGPSQDWNTRREFRATPSHQRELYYCRADRRIHLKGASEGWLCAGHLGNTEPWGEFRMFDLNGDGYFDRWEVYQAGSAGPVRVSTVTDAGIRDLPKAWDELQALYTKELLPEALEAGGRLIEAMRQIDAFTPPENLATALKAATCDSERCYVQDLIREMHYQRLRQRLLQQSTKMLSTMAASDLRKNPEAMTASERAWEWVRDLSRLDAAYGEGRFDEAIVILKSLAKSLPGSAPAEENRKPKV